LLEGAAKLYASSMGRAFLRLKRVTNQSPWIMRIGSIIEVRKLAQPRIDV
jgi:hypothetical protein